MNDFEFYPEQRIIQINNGVTQVDSSDLYSRWKDWAIVNPQWLGAFRVVGGDPTIGSNRISPYYFLINGWRLKPSEANQTLQISGILLVDGGGDPYLSTDGTFNVRIVATIPLEAEFIVAQLPEIEFASFQNAVWYDSNSSNSGIAYPRGTRQRPVNNITDALAILGVQGFGRLGLLSSATFGIGHNIENIEVFGQSSSLTEVTVLPEALTNRCRFNNLFITGELDGDTTLSSCDIGDLHYVNGMLHNCSIRSDATISLDGGANAQFIDCTSGPPEIMESFPIIDMGGAGQSLSVRNFNGKLKITNKTGIEKVSLDINSGHIVIDSTVTNGIIVSRGIGKFENNSTGTATVISEDMLNRAGIANAVWEDDVKARALDGSHSKAGFFLSRTVNDIGTVSLVNGNQVTFTGSMFNTTPSLYEGRVVQFHKNGEFVYEIRKVIQHLADGILVLDRAPVIVNNDDPWHAYILPILAGGAEADEMASAVWDAQLIGYQAEGSAGNALATSSTGGVDVQILVDAIWNAQLTNANYNVPTSAGKKLRQVASNIITEGMSVGATANSLTLDSASSIYSNSFVPSTITIAAGAGVGQSRSVLEYNNTTHTAIVDRNWGILPDITSEYIITSQIGREHVNEGLSQGVGSISNSIILNNRASDFNDVYKGQVVFIRSGTGKDQACKITAYNGTTKEATISREWVVAPDATSAYVILPSGMFGDEYVSSAVWDADNNQFISAGSTGQSLIKARNAESVSII